MTPTKDKAEQSQLRAMRYNPRLPKGKRQNVKAPGKVRQSARERTPRLRRGC